EQSIDTLDLSSPDNNNHANSGLSAGRDLILRSPTQQLGNRPDPDQPLYTVGSYFRTEQLDRTVVDLWIPYDDAQVVLADADIEFSQNYDGPSLYYPGMKIGVISMPHKQSLDDENSD
ncbi:MAG: hypothetical protein AAGL17_14280, partial [Cyanobacteria bacterium J06576_12]